MISGRFLYRYVCISICIHFLPLLCVNSTVGLGIGRWTIFLALKEIFELFFMSLWDQFCFGFFPPGVVHFRIYYLNHVHTKKKDFAYVGMILEVYLFFFNLDLM